MIFIGKNQTVRKRKKKDLTVINISKPKENAPRHHITNFHQNKVEKDWEKQEIEYITEKKLLKKLIQMSKTKNIRGKTMQQRIVWKIFF